MATVFIDGFDKYGITGLNSPTLTTTINQEWNVINTAPSLVAGLSGTGYAVSVGFNYIQKTLTASYSRLIGGCRIQCQSIGGGVTTVPVQFLNVSTAQCTIHVQNDGTIYLGTGGTGGIGVAGSTTSMTNNSIHYLEWDITFAASGAYQLWLDGVSLFSGTGNVGSGTANVISMGRNTGNNAYNGQVIIDDLYLFDTTGSSCNAVLNTNPRIETQYPTSDTQTQWTNAGNVLIPVGLSTPLTGVANVTATAFAPGANIIALQKYTPNVNCTLQSIGLLSQTTSAPAKFKAVLYADSAGAPNTLTATGTEVTGTTSGTTLTLPFGSGQSLTGGTSYWLGYITDTSINFSQINNDTAISQRKANTYASGPPSPAGGSFTAGAPVEMWGNATGATTNWESVASNPANGAGPAGDSSTITSSTLNNEDLYGFPALTTTPASVYTVAVKGNLKLTGTGTRTITLRTKSSSTDSAGSNAGSVPNNTYGWVSSHFDQDPNGPTAWTGANVNSATSGVKVTI